MCRLLRDRTPYRTASHSLMSSLSAVVSGGRAHPSIDQGGEFSPLAAGQDPSPCHLTTRTRCCARGQSELDRAIGSSTCAQVRGTPTWTGTLGRVSRTGRRSTGSVVGPVVGCHVVHQLVPGPPWRRSVARCPSREAPYRDGAPPVRRQVQVTWDGGAGTPVTGNDHRASLLAGREPPSRRGVDVAVGNVSSG